MVPVPFENSSRVHLTIVRIHRAPDPHEFFILLAAKFE